MEPWVDDFSDDLQSMSFNSTNDINRSTSSGSETTSFSSRLPSARASIHFNHQIALSDLRFIQRLGAGDIGSVFLAELKTGTPSSNDAVFAAKDNCAEYNPEGLFMYFLKLHKCSLSIIFVRFFEATSIFLNNNKDGINIMGVNKVMDRKELEGRNKEGRARTEREILEMLDHPFLPMLYATIESPKWICLLTEFCPGGDLHVLRQRQPAKRFTESAVRFYASEVVVALEYLHMMGIVYRDLKPENVLVRSDGHIMLTDFDLSLKCDSSKSTAQIVSDQTPPSPTPVPVNPSEPLPFRSTSCILPNCIVPSVSCFHLKKKRKKKTCGVSGPEFVSEPIDVRSMSFVGTHEYLAPEIVSGEGHGSAVDWWTLGVFIFELFYGVTPFKGLDNDMTLANIVARALEFPKEPSIPAVARDLISQLLVKDPTRRLGSTMGASAIRHHSFFQGVNWALLRCTSPPFVPPPFNRDFVSDESCPDTPMDYY